MNEHDIERYHLHEGSMALPAGFADRTANLFIMPDRTSSAPNLSIARDQMQAGEDLARYVDRQLGIMKAKLTGHRVDRRTPSTLGQDGQAITGEQIDAHYKNGKLTIWQRQAAFSISGPRVLIFSASCPHALDEQFDTLWRAWLDSFVPRPE
ncbi:hypothetical protein HNQ59_001856 [Chitinivorax tropicus]|uniref:DUF1795 domain-containing protein n=1 Tax=Chitinivorax tropicus TaxID=714531 RepID=A0A840MNJ3_9PROT|nr:DUF1795 domain-containing protein [Chitinivorax tropicus]MBB5018567.1 hypothetical protein [Chitinivorax tropicus]